MAVPTYHENPAEHAARLLTGAGVATISTTTDGQSPTEPVPVLHGRDSLGTAWVLIHPNHIDCPYTSVPATMTVRENAPLAAKHLTLSTLSLTGSLDPKAALAQLELSELTCDLNDALNAWPEAQLARFIPDSITLATTISSHTIDPYAACLAEPDTLAAQGTDVTDTLNLEFGPKLLPLMGFMSNQHNPGLELDNLEDLHIVSADSQGITMLCHNDQTHWYMRLPFTHKTTSLTGARHQLSKFLTCAYSSVDKCPYLGRH